MKRIYPDSWYKKKAAPAPAPAEPEPEHNMKRFDLWLVEFGTFLDRSGRRSELATAIGISPQSVYRDFAFVQAECADLAGQLAALR